MALVDYKGKYQEIKSQFMNAVDVAWRSGYEQGAKDAQAEQAQMQSQMAIQPGQAPQEGATEEQPQESGSQHPDGSELDQHIQKLEDMLGKSELLNTDVSDLKKTLQDIKLYQGQIALTKSLESIKKSIIHKPMLLPPKAAANLDHNSKNTLNLQEKIINDVMKSWEDEEKRASKDISNIINIEDLSSKG